MPPAQDGPGTVTENVTHRQPIAIHYRWVVTVVVLIVDVGGLYGAYLKRSDDVERIDLVSNELNHDLAKIQKEPVPVVNGSKTIYKAESSLNNDSTTFMESKSVEAEENEPTGVIQVSEFTETNEEKLTDAGSISESGVDESQNSVEDNSVVSKRIQPDSQAPISKQGAVRSAASDLTKSQGLVKQKVNQTLVVKTKVNPEGSTVNPIADTLVQTGFVAKVKLPSVGSTSISSGQSTALKTPVDEVNLIRTKAQASQETDLIKVVAQSRRKITFTIKRGSRVIVYDGKGVELLRRYFSTDKVVTVSGSPPFDVRLRGLRGLRVVYNGKVADVPAPSNGDKIRFQVGGIGSKTVLIQDERAER